MIAVLFSIDYVRSHAMKSYPFAVLFAIAYLFVAPHPAAQGDDKTQPASRSAEKSLDKNALYERFAQTLSNVKLVGNYTVLGKSSESLPKEEYTISSATKLDEGDYWLFRTRIKYGENDVAVPLALEVKWAGDTPVITLSDLTIPELGTFTARVIIYNNKYAGTWTHGKVGGHLFGTIEKNKTDP
jgi:hypothetical protein